MIGKKVNPSPLFQAIKEKRWESAVMIAKSYPESAKSQVLVSMDNNKYRMRCLPLHWACLSDPDQHIIETLLQCYPHAIKMTDSCFYCLPIHFACLHSENEGIVRMLLNAYPDGAYKLGLHGRLPIHHACLSGASSAVIKALLEFNPTGSQTVDKMGMLPIHLACIQNSPVEVIQMLLQSCPESVHFKTRNGKTPIVCTKKIHDCENKKAIVSLLGASSARSLNHRFNARGSDKFKCEQIFTQTRNAVELGEFC